MQFLAAGAPLLHSLTQAGAVRLLDGLEVMAVVWSRFHLEAPEDTVSKAVVFESVPWFTDYLARYSKLHCGRCARHVAVAGQIIPLPAVGCPHYTYRKRVRSALVVVHFGHHTPNCVGPELTRRSTSQYGSRSSISCPT
ncbi:hypothetical protein TPL01_10530 [Sulfuriferula plumbiphila]|uniref:Transposase zinc-binding domain-containing protein n=1 Tax=Sulfuriferula plumbiphila TaxID=171865 RepID=A0A512L613_9PROT|nr:hypothetical protein [Sulfuriferula plumbiphila]BBP05172.1 hypothetical protein SFPGR_25940 [Sulfuriferula plumbiphila]GEP29915.1 hypothetical protein TPL01_10530 [Sulfuriferula plumbiphila]